MKAILTAIILFLFSITTFSQTVDIEKAKLISLSWASTHDLSPEVENILCKTIGNDTLLYIVNFRKAWVIISADRSLIPILGFSFDSKYSENNEPDALKSLFDFYAYVKQENKTNGIEYSAEWKSLESENLKTATSVSEVNPLIPVTWNQTWPYNAYCPLDSEVGAGFNGHHNTSCGPTAFAQILRYWRYPVHGIGYHSYWYDRFSCTVEANFGATYYNWDNMPSSLPYDDPESTYKDIATLMLHAAVSVDGAWGGGGSVSQYSSAAVKYFAYSPTCRVLYRDDFTNSGWHSIFRNDLNNGRPILIAGNSAGSVEPWEKGTVYGHYFICDGYYGSDFYHINWGWGGSSNGYFPLFSLGSFVFHNQALIGLEPNYENKELSMNDPYTTDNNTVVLLHFDGDLTNQSSLSDNPTGHGSTSFIDNSSMRLGQCLYLNNSSQENQSYLDIVDNNNLDLSGDWTIEMWFKPNSFGDNWYNKYTLINKPGDSENFDSNYLVYMLPTSDYLARSLVCSFFPTEQVESNPAYLLTDKNFLEAGNWYHFAFIRNTSDKTLKLVIHDSNRDLIHYASIPYFNEVASEPLLNSNPLLIGSGNESNTFFDGYIDELRISNVVREFEITSTSLTLSTPNGGEAWESGTLQAIRWNSENISNLKIEYSIDNGSTWLLISNSFNASQGSYFWEVPEVVSQQCLVRITDTSDDNTFQQSSSVFEIYDQLVLTLIAPNGGETYQSGSEIPIIWEMTGVNEIDIYYSSDGGSIWTQIISGHSAHDILYSWNVPAVISSNCKIKIEGNTISNESAGLFEIIDSEIPGGPFTANGNTVLLLSLDNNLNNKSSFSSNAFSNGSYSFSSNTVSSMGYCINLDGNSSLTVPHNSYLNLTEDWKIEMWFNINSLNAVLINKQTESWESNYRIHVESPDGHMEARFYDSDNTRYQISSPTGTVETGKWYHVAFINDNSNRILELIIRNEDQSIKFQHTISYPSGTVPATSSKNVTIGAQVDGYIDELRISTADQIRQDIDLNTGWNILSFNVEPDNKNLLNTVQPLIDDEKLHKIIDEGGNILQYMPWGWVNNIGDMANTEGYYAKVTSNVTLSVLGTVVQCPFDIDLYAGWNIMGYPCQNPKDAMAVLQALIDAGKVSKVIDEGGNILQYMPWGWVNNIGDLAPGEGYYIKLSENASITFEEPGEPTPLKIKYSGIETSETEFFRISQQGNPYMPMTIVLTDVDNLGYASEIGIFDGDLCVGAGIIYNDKIYISAAAGDPYSPEIDGFISGNTIIIKVLDRVHGTAYVLEPELIHGDYIFSPLETFIGSLKSYSTDLFKTGLETNYLGLSFPNPASDYTTIEYGLAETSSVKLTVYNQLGKTIRVLNITDQPSGIHQYIIDWNNLGQGIYYYRLETTGDSGYFSASRMQFIGVVKKY